MSLPSNFSSPEVGGSISVTMRASVDLPQPDSPTTASVLPVWSAKETPSTALTVASARNSPRFSR